MSRTSWVWVAVSVLVLVLLLGAGLVVSTGWGRGYGYGWGMMGPGMMGGWWGIPFLGPIFMLVLVGLFIGGAVWFVQSLTRGATQMGSGRTAAETPLEMLKRRFASGEITKEQFEEMRRTLNT
jgi:putative membrane protein